MINFIALGEGNVELFAGKELIVASNNADVLAADIVNAGGFAGDGTISASSSCDFAEEYGFATQEEFEVLWEKTLKIVERINELKKDVADALKGAK